MNYKELNDALNALQEKMMLLEEEYEMNGGEVTEMTEEREKEVELLSQLLDGEGVDYLGRNIKSKKDQVKTYKAERDYISRQIYNLEKGIERLEFLSNMLLALQGKEKVKGTRGYTIIPYTKVKTEVDKVRLEELYQEKVNEAVRDVLPGHVTVKLAASVKAVPEGMELPDIFKVTETPSCKFLSPRANKEEE